MSEKLNLEQQLSEMEKKYFVAWQQLDAQSQNELKLQNENRIVRHSLNQELDTSAQLKRKAAVMEDNYRKIEKENERLQKLTDNQERAANQLQDDLKNERAASSQQKLDNQRQNEEKEARINMLSEKLALEQSESARVLQQHNDDVLQLSEMGKKYFVVRQQVDALRDCLRMN